MRLYFRILKYIRPYGPSLFGSVICILFFTLFNSAFQLSVIPFLNTLFQPPAQQTASQTTLDSPEQLLDNAVPSRLGESKEALKEKFMSFFQGQSREKALQRICIIILIITLGKNFFAYMQQYLMAHVEQGSIRDIRDDLYKQINNQSLGYFNETRAGHLISRITNDVTLVNGGVSASFVTLIKNPLAILASLAIALYLSWQLTLISFIVAPFSIAIISWIGLELRKQSTESQEKMADVTSVLAETISGARIVKAFAMEKFEIKKFMCETHAFYKTMLRITRTRNLASPLTEFLGTCVAIGILWFGGRQVLRGDMMAPEEFIGFLVIILSVMTPVKELSSVNNRIQEALAAGKRIFDVIDLEPEIVNAPDPVAVNTFTHQIRFQNVTFGYDPESPVLNDIDLTVNKGQIIALVGPSGAGKSTLVDLIPRFYDPQQGSITLDGLDIRQIELKHLRRLMGIVTQETILFNDTVQNNIAYGLLDHSVDEVKEAAQIANAHDFIERLPKGYDTPIGERGIQLSGGQRQRLAIARAVLKNPPILILDEATSALDTESELLVQQAIERLMQNRTSFVIAHRLSTVLHADQILVLENGNIVQKGKHKELLAATGLYKKLYNMQFRT
ncbi:ATP-binding cassette domain-containing protein [candidate division KSB1 bacterium]|nr:ATP-binding cassette domain-containing protein [candidate division KSB1 bacterium]